jgi:YEATS domain-containing protein 4
VTVYRAIVYGSEATPLTHVKNPPENVHESHTHQWKVSLRGPGNSDVSHFIKKVVFKLHDSFAFPTRCIYPLIPPEYTTLTAAIEEPPFEVTETGWGEFEIQIKVHFVPEASEKPMTLFHFLHLHPYGPNKEEEREKGSTVEAFQYEEIVFPPPFVAWENEVIIGRCLVILRKPFLTF